MVSLNINEEVYKRLQAFKKVIDVILEKELPDMDAYASFVLSIGINKMIRDVISEDELLATTLVAMFKENPEFVASFIAKTLKKGNEEIERAKSAWKQMII